MYQFRDNQLHQITEDHSFVNRLVKIGKISQAEARTHPQRNIIMRFVGYNTELEVDLYSFVLQPGDWLMLCNSYFWQSVPDNEIEEVIKGYSHPDDVTKQLQKFEKLEWQDYVYIIVKMD